MSVGARFSTVSTRVVGNYFALWISLARVNAVSGRARRALGRDISPTLNLLLRVRHFFFGKPLSLPQKMVSTINRFYFALRFYGPRLARCPPWRAFVPRALTTPALAL